MSSIFIDTNILLDILISNRANHSKAVGVFYKISQDYQSLVTSEDVLTTVEYIASKQGLDCEKIWNFFDILQKRFEIINFHESLNSSLEEYHNYCKDGKKIDFEDLLQVKSAIFHGCQAFLTEDRGLLIMGDMDIEVVSLDGFS